MSVKVINESRDSDKAMEILEDLLMNVQGAIEDMKNMECIDMHYFYGIIDSAKDLSKMENIVYP